MKTVTWEISLRMPVNYGLQAVADRIYRVLDSAAVLKEEGVEMYGGPILIKEENDLDEEG